MTSNSGGKAPPPAPFDASQGRTDRRRWWICALAGLTLVLAIGVWAGVRWWTSDPWSDMEEVASTFPIPDGFELVDLTRGGDRPAVCDIKPCNPPQLTVTYAARSGSSRTCQVIDSALEEWERRGFSLDASSGSEGDVLCMFQGEIDDSFVRVFGIASAPDDEPGFALVIGG